MSQDALQLILPSIVNRLINKRNIDKTRKNNKGGKLVAADSSQPINQF